VCIINRWFGAKGQPRCAETNRKPALSNDQQIRDCYQQAAECARQADAQTDTKVKKQYLELARLWLLLASGYEFDKASVKSSGQP
jgi:hypothetical protein